MKYVPGFVLCVCALALGGCGTKAITRNTGEIDLVKKGWAPSQVKNKIGDPLYRNEGRDIDLGREEWVYPKGSVVFRRLEVVAVKPRNPGDPLPARQRDDAFDYPKHLFEEEEGYYERRGEEARRQSERYEGAVRKFQPGRTREEVARTDPRRRDDAAMRGYERRYEDDYYGEDYYSPY